MAFVESSYLAYLDLGRTIRSALSSNKQSTEELHEEIGQQEAKVYALINFIRGHGVETKLDSLLGLLQDPSKQRRERREAIIQWLKATSTDEQLDDSLRRRYPGTCEWVLQTKEFREWLEPCAKAKLLWIYGPAAFGKTVLSARAVEHLRDDLSKPIAFFFCVSEVASTQDPYQILRSWIAQMVQSIDGAVDAVWQTYQKYSNRSPTRTELWYIFQELAAPCHDISLVIDGYDECEPTDTNSKFQTEDRRAVFLQELTQNLTKTTMRLLITSRDVPDIRTEVVRAGEMQPADLQAFYLQITPESNCEDILEVSKGIVARKLPNKNDLTRSEIADLAARKSEGMFLLLDLIGNGLKSGKNSKALISSISEMPPGIEAAYRKDLDRLAHMEDSDKGHVIAMLRWILFSSRPLSVLELIEATALATSDRTSYPWDDLPDQWGHVDGAELNEEEVNSLIREPCGSLIEIRASENAPLGSHTVHFVHYSVREYLVNPGRSGDLSLILKGTSFSDIGLQHDLLAKFCISYISFDEFDTPDQNGQLLRQMLLRFPFLEYASKHWTTHMRKSHYSEALLQSTAEFCDASSNKWARTLEIQSIPRINAGSEEEETEMERFDAMWTSRETEEKEEISYDTEQEDTRPATSATFQNPVGPLAYMAHLGFQTVVKSFLLQGVDVNYVGGLCGNALQAAIDSSEWHMATLLIEHGADISQTCGLYGSALNAAAARGSLDWVRLLRELGASICNEGKNGKTALHYACLSDSSELVAYLLEEGADVNFHTAGSHSPLQIASRKGAADIVRLLLKHGAETKDAAEGAVFKTLPLYLAVFHNHLQVVKLLLEFGADLGYKSAVDGETLLHTAAMHSSVDMVDYLLSKGLRKAINEKKNEGDGIGYYAFTATLMRSVPNMEILKLLIDQGADVNARHSDNDIPILALAFMLLLENPEVGLEKLLEFMRILMAAGADPEKESTIIDDRGASRRITVLMVIVSQGHLEMTEELLSRNLSNINAVDGEYGHVLPLAIEQRNHKIARALVEHGADANARNCEGVTALSGACYIEDLELMSLLLEHGADPDLLLSDDTASLLWCTARDGKTKTAELLLQHGAQVNFVAKDRDNYTPLHTAAAKGHGEMVSLLLQHGADTTAKTEGGKSAADLASSFERQDVVEILKKHDASSVSPKN